jgi:hypothetical protein
MQNSPNMLRFKAGSFIDEMESSILEERVVTSEDFSSYHLV